jgi:hypothetical protein
MVSRAFGDFSLKWPEGTAPPFEADWTRLKVTADPDIVIWPRPHVGVLAIMSDGLVETATNALKPLAHVGRDIYIALKTAHYDLAKAATVVNQRHAAAAPQPYDGDDLTMVLVDVGLKEAGAVQAAGGATLAAAAAAGPASGGAAIRVKSRKARPGKRNKTGKRTRLAKIFCLQG